MNTITKIKNIFLFFSMSLLVSCSNFNQILDSKKSLKTTELSNTNKELPIKKVENLIVKENKANIWDIIRTRFAINDSLNNDLVKYFENIYKKEIKLYSRPAKKYLYFITQELEKRKMPSELVLIPFVESSLNPLAVSKVKAAGLWQIMPATGRSLNLRQDIFVDDRLDIVKSTNAALNYLQYLNKKFNNWYLTLIAYNWGEGNLNKILKNNNSEINFETLKIPKESKNYIHKIQALKNIINNPSSFNINLPYIKNEPYFIKVEVNDDIDIQLMITTINLNSNEFKELNPSFKNNTIYSSITSEILLPLDKVELIK